MEFYRYAVFFTAPQTPLADFGATWLGWDSAAGKCAGSAPEAGHEKMVKPLRRYGFHATIIAPFYLADDLTQQQAVNRFVDFCAATPAASIGGLVVRQLGRFLTLAPTGDTAEIDRLAANAVQELNCLRKVQTQQEDQRRTPANATARQVELVQKYGYCRVLEEFGFHMTLTSKLDNHRLRDMQQKLEIQMGDLVPSPFPVLNLSFMGEDNNGFFHTIETRALSQK